MNTFVSTACLELLGFKISSFQGGILSIAEKCLVFGQLFEKIIVLILFEAVYLG